MPVGPRAKPGRPPGTGAKTVKRKAAEAAKLQGKLPHEILLDAARGECFKVRRLHITYFKSGPQKGQEKSREWIEEDYWPTYHERIDAAKAAGPYYAPKLAVQYQAGQVGKKQSGVMLVPVPPDGDWAKAAAAKQSELKKNVKS